MGNGRGHTCNHNTGGHVVEDALAGGEQVMGRANPLWARTKIIGQQDAVAGVEMEKRLSSVAGNNRLTPGQAPVPGP